MAAAREQAEEGRVERLGTEIEGRDVPVEVVHRREGQPASERDPLRGREPDEERPDQPRPRRHGHEVDVVERRAGLGEGLPHDRRDELEMPSG